MQLILKALIIVFACAFTVTEATALQRAKSCVSKKWVKTLHLAGLATYRFRLTNNCSYAVVFDYHDNRFDSCSPGRSSKINPGVTHHIDIHQHGRKIGGEINWCVNYWNNEVQERTGYGECESRCPSGYR